MTLYRDPQYERVRSSIEKEIRAGVRVLSTSYVVGRSLASPDLVQRVLADLVKIGDLTPHYRVYCSGEHENNDVDGEYGSLASVPKHPITCSRCGDIYTPRKENISVFFEPSSTYLNELQVAS
jgi:hypothetical protein